MIGVYHNRDLDGFTSGAIIKLKYPDAKMVGYDYGETFEQEVTGEPIIMAGVSLPMKTMVKIAQLSNWQLTWIDHHISAINDYKEFVGDSETFCNAILENGIAACEGTWKHLFPDKQIPLAVKLLGEYDTWRNADKQRWESEILPFQFGMRLYCNSVDSFPIEVFENEELVKQIIHEGLTVLKYQSQVNEWQCKKASFETEFNGLRAICLNGGGFNSDVFKSVYDENRHDIMMSFQFDGNKWTISLYTTKDDVDCSAIAKTNGGGGHKKAAGFQVEDISKVFSQIQIAVWSATLANTVQLNSKLYFMHNLKILKTKQQKKNEALNEIRKIFNPEYKFPYNQVDPYGDGDWDDLPSCAEEREKRISNIIERLEKDLKELKVVTS